MAITQAEFEFLIGEDKLFDDLATSIKLGPSPIHWTRQINSESTKEIFLLDFYRGSLELSKYTVNHRYRQTVILLRYDNGGRHTNPDGVSFEGAHVHIYCEGFNDKFAYPISKIGVDNSDSMEIVFTKIMHFCNVRKYPNIEVSMF